MTVFWFIAVIILLLIELVTLNLVTIWFALGSVSAMVVSLYIDSIVIQVIIFIVVSIISLLVTKPVIKRFKLTKITPTNSDMIIGKIGIVTKKIESNKYGEVKVYGNTWTASGDSEIDVGTRVKVLSISGVKLIVEKEDE